MRAYVSLRRSSLEKRAGLRPLRQQLLSRGHVLVVPRRHVAGFFDMSAEEQAACLTLRSQAQRLVQARHSPDGYNIGVNVGKAAGQSRMHVHVHLIPRYEGDVADPRGGVRCVLTSK